MMTERGETSLDSEANPTIHLNGVFFFSTVLSHWAMCIVYRYKRDIEWFKGHALRGMFVFTVSLRVYMCRFPC